MKYILFFYSLALALFISISGLLATKKSQAINLQLIFLPVVLYFFIKSLRLIRKKEGLEGNLGKGTIIFSILILLMLMGINLGETLFNNKAAVETPTPAALQAVLPTPTLEEKAKKVIISIEDGSPQVNIRNMPTIYSQIIKKVKSREIFEVVEEEKEWFKIKLEEGDYGYIAKKYARLITNE